jgi:seryl-tRNA synthetase
MIDLKFLRENPEIVQKNTERKREKAAVSDILALDEERRSIIATVEKLKSERNSASKQIGVMKKNKEDASEVIQGMQKVSAEIKQLDEKLRAVEEDMKGKTAYIPNILHESVPDGKGAEDNVEIRSWGEQNAQEFRVDHMEICKKLNLIDFERGAKISGSGFSFYTGAGATLERALINFMVDMHIQKNGYTEVLPPFAVNEASMKGTGQLPKMAEDMYRCADDDLYLIPTAEVPITNVYRDEILQPEQVPTKFCGFSPCFRREAGSYGKDTRGLLRLHQFHKVELVKFVHPDNSYDELESLVGDVEAVLKALEIPYRVIVLCSGDTSFASAKTYDIEVWSPCEQKWLEASSCSNFEDFQARRANIRFRNEQGKPQFMHTLNGSGLATSRLMVAILEQYQTDHGTLRVPAVLQKYIGKEEIGG